MKFSHYLKSIDHVSIYPAITLILFVTVFVGMAIYVFNTDKETMKERSNIPLN